MQSEIDIWGEKFLNEIKSAISKGKPIKFDGEITIRDNEKNHNNEKKIDITHCVSPTKRTILRIAKDSEDKE